MAESREKLSHKPSLQLRRAARDISSDKKPRPQTMSEDAISLQIGSQVSQKIRPQVMAHYRASVEKNRRLLELLAE